MSFKDDLKNYLINNSEYLDIKYIKKLLNNDKFDNNIKNTNF